MEDSYSISSRTSFLSKPHRRFDHRPSTEQKDVPADMHNDIDKMKVSCCLLIIMTVVVTVRNNFL